MPANTNACKAWASSKGTLYHLHTGGGGFANGKGHWVTDRHDHSNVATPMWRATPTPRQLATYRAAISTSHSTAGLNLAELFELGLTERQSWAAPAAKAKPVTSAPPALINAAKMEPPPPAHPRTDTDGSEFLRSMESEASALGKAVGKPDYWAKPFYSSITTLTQGTTRAFIGLNGAGDRWSHQLDSADGNAVRPWADPRYNAFLDERWGKKGNASSVGTAQLQRAIQAVFTALYDDAWEGVLRSAACFNIVPVSSGGQNDPVLVSNFDTWKRWGLKLVEYLRPQLLILNGNGRRSAWSALDGRFGIREIAPPLPVENPTFRLKEGEIMWSGQLRCRVIGLPHLSLNKASPLLLRGLKARKPYI